MGFQKWYSDHSVFIYKTSSGTVILVNVYDILLTRSDVAGIVKTKEYLKTQYVTKDKGKPRYLFGIEIAHNKYRVVLS